MDIRIENIKPIKIEIIDTNNLDYSVYIDFDNLYRGLIDNLNLIIKPSKEEEKATRFQLLVFREILKCILKSLSYTGSEKARYIKAFAEFENLPFQEAFNVNIPAFLYNLGIKPINPFTAYSKKGKKKRINNASDVSLTLEVVSDVLVKKVFVKLIIIVSGDIDFYPLVSWLKEYTDKEILILSFGNRLNPIYKELIDFHLITKEDTLTYLDTCLKNCLKELFKYLFNNKNCIYKLNSDYVILAKKDINWLKDKIERYLPEEKNLKETFLEVEKEFSMKNQFIENLLSGIKNWFREHPYLTANLIIENWLPNWNLDISKDEANKCLKNLLPYLENQGYKFEGKVEDFKIIGKFVKIN
jgi:uncharacterized LabA/DUF88 family protein